MNKHRIAAFVALCAVSVAAATGYVLHAGSRDDRQSKLVAAGTIDDVTGVDQTPGTGPRTLDAVEAEPHAVIRNMTLGGAGRIEVAGLSDPDGRRAFTDLSCLRVYMAGGRGLCLNNDGGVFSPFQAVFFGADFKPYGHQSLPGIISRARISPDGRYGATTVFVSGDSYADGNFSTRTAIYDMEHASRLADLEDYTVFKDGSQIHSVDFNFWGVTFAGDSNVFYATLGTAGHTYLVKGDVAARRVEVLRDGVECPSLSPDGTRLAFKQRVGTDASGIQWRPAVLDLATLEGKVLAETKNLDDQIEWLDNETVVYAIDTGEGAPDTYATRADGTGASHLFFTDADSPSVAR